MFNMSYVGRAIRYYSQNASMSTIPTSSHVVPDGGAIDILAHMLETRKQEGVIKTSENCQVPFPIRFPQFLVRLLLRRSATGGQSLGMCRNSRASTPGEGLRVKQQYSYPQRKKRSFVSFFEKWGLEGKNQQYLFCFL
jgi:hypothetical protein